MIYEYVQNFRNNMDGSCHVPGPNPFARVAKIATKQTARGSVVWWVIYECINKKSGRRFSCTAGCLWWDSFIDSVTLCAGGGEICMYVGIFIQKNYLLWIKETKNLWDDAMPAIQNSSTAYSNTSMSNSSVCLTNVSRSNLSRICWPDDDLVCPIYFQPSQQIWRVILPWRWESEIWTQGCWDFLSVSWVDNVDGSEIRLSPVDMV